MNKTVVAIIFAGYLLAPFIYSWMSEPNGSWYRPFIVWGVAILLLSFVSRRGSNDV